MRTRVSLLHPSTISTLHRLFKPQAFGNVYGRISKPAVAILKEQSV